MNINSLKSNKRHKIIFFIVLFIIFVSSITLYLLFIRSEGQKNTTNQQDINSVNYKKPSSEQVKNGNSIKSNSLNNTNTDKPPAPTPIQNSSKSNVQMTITAANQNDQALQIRTLIETIESSGECTLMLSANNKTTITKTSNTQSFASTSTCNGFDVPISEMSAGIWHIKIDFNSASLVGSTSKDVEIK